MINPGDYFSLYIRLVLGKSEEDSIKIYQYMYRNSTFEDVETEEERLQIGL